MQRKKETFLPVLVLPTPTLTLTLMASAMTPACNEKKERNLKKMLLAALALASASALTPACNENFFLKMKKRMKKIGISGVGVGAGIVTCLQ